MFLNTDDGRKEKRKRVFTILWHILSSQHCIQWELIDCTSRKQSLSRDSNPALTDRSPFTLAVGWFELQNTARVLPVIIRDVMTHVISALTPNPWSNDLLWQKKCKKRSCSWKIWSEAPQPEMTTSRGRTGRGSWCFQKWKNVWNKITTSKSPDSFLLKPFYGSLVLFMDFQFLFENFL